MAAAHSVADRGFRHDASRSSTRSRSRQDFVTEAEAGVPRKSVGSWELSVGT
jgi:hypothetical protein